MRLHCRRWGRGRPLFLVPGWGMPAALFAPLAEALSGWELTAVDLPGQGRSPDAAYTPAELAPALLKAAPANALWLGWSLGVPLALEAARRAPPRGLCLIAGSPRLVAGEDWPGVAAAALADMRRRLGSEPEAVWREFLRLLAGRGSGSRAVARALLRQPAPAGGPGLASGLAALAHTDLRPVLGELAVPALWLVGDADPLVPARAGQAAARAMPDARCRVEQGPGHLLPLTHPQRIAAALEELWERIDD